MAPGLMRPPAPVCGWNLLTAKTTARLGRIDDLHLHLPALNDFAKVRYDTAVVLVKGTDSRGYPFCIKCLQTNQGYYTSMGESYTCQLYSNWNHLEKLLPGHKTQQYKRTLEHTQDEGWCFCFWLTSIGVHLSGLCLWRLCLWGLVLTSGAEPASTSARHTSRAPALAARCRAILGQG